MRDHQHDSFGLFADVLAGTLGIVALIALLMVLAAGDWHVTPETIHENELRSAALPEQVTAAKKRAQRSEEQLHDELKRVASITMISPDALIAQVKADAVGNYYRDRLPTATGDLLLERRENLRLGEKIAELTVMNDALGNMLVSLRERQQRVDMVRRFETTKPLRVLREGQEMPRPFYLICRGAKIYAAYVFQDELLRRNNRDMSWIVLPGRGRSRCFPLPERGWSLADAREQIRFLVPQLRRRPEYYVVTLAFPDSFLEARQLMQLLDTADLAFSWRPYPAGEAVDFAIDGVTPPPPL